ncbi:hypothetical protein NECAME_17571, partial [Necator americanus]
MCVWAQFRSFVDNAFGGRRTHASFPEHFIKFTAAICCWNSAYIYYFTHPDRIFSRQVWRFDVDAEPSSKDPRQKTYGQSGKFIRI